MIGKTEVTYASCTAFLQQKIQHSVVDVAGMKRGHSVIAHTHTVQQQVVEVVCLQFLERIAVHGDGGIAAPGGGREVRQFRGYEIMVAGMAFPWHVPNVPYNRRGRYRNSLRRAPEHGRPAR